MTLLCGASVLPWVPETGRLGTQHIINKYLGNKSEHYLEQQQKKSGEASNTGRSNSQEAKLKACNVITVYQPRLILIWFLNSCVIKTAKRTASGERRRRGGKKRHFTNA